MKNDATSMIAIMTVLFGARPCSKALISQISYNHSAVKGVLATHQTSFTSAHLSHVSPGNADSRRWILYHLHFMNEETGPERLSNYPKVTQLVRSGRCDCHLFS